MGSRVAITTAENTSVDWLTSSPCFHPPWHVYDGHTVTRWGNGTGWCEMCLMWRGCITACAALLKKNLPTCSSITTLLPPIKYYNVGWMDDDGGKKQMAQRIVNVKHTNTHFDVDYWVVVAGLLGWGGEVKG